MKYYEIIQNIITSEKNKTFVYCMQTQKNVIADYKDNTKVCFQPTNQVMQSKLSNMAMPTTPG